jgi:hypothetical protein
MHFVGSPPFPSTGHSPSRCAAQQGPNIHVYSRFTQFTYSITGDVYQIKELAIGSCHRDPPRESNLDCVLLSLPFLFLCVMACGGSCSSCCCVGGFLICSRRRFCPVDVISAQFFFFFCVANREPGIFTRRRDCIWFQLSENRMTPWERRSLCVLSVRGGSGGVNTKPGKSRSATPSAPDRKFPVAPALMSS